MFLKSVLAEQFKALPQDKGDNDYWNMFDRVIIGDSCKFSIPENLKEDYPGFNGCRPSKALMNLQYNFDIKKGTWLSLDFTKATQNDQSYSPITFDQVFPNDLHIRDLGFVTLNYIQNIIEKEAFFLNRTPPNWMIYVQKNNKTSEINWKDVYKKFNKFKLTNLELKVYVGKNHKIPCRLIVSLVPQEVYEQRIKKAEKHAKSKGINVSDAYRFRCRFNTFITNAPSETLKTEDVDDLGWIEEMASV